MTSVKKIGQNYYIVNIPNCKTKNSNKYKGIFIIKAHSATTDKYMYGVLGKFTKDIYCPKELVGKHVRLRVEIIDDVFLKTYKGSLLYLGSNND